MIPIRIKIIFLAFFALILLSFMLFREYSNDKLNLMHAENSFESIDKIIELSKVIHTLQKERGLSIAMVSKGKSSVTQKLNEQRNETDKKLKELETQRLFEDLHQEFLKKLPNIRDAINKKTLNWYETKEFYTQQIDESLITILTLLNTFEQNKIHDKLNAFIVCEKNNSTYGLGIEIMNLLNSILFRVSDGLREIDSKLIPYAEYGRDDKIFNEIMYKIYKYKSIDK